MEELQDDTAVLLFEHELSDQLILEYELSTSENLYVYSLDNKIYLLKEKAFTTDKKFQYQIDIFDNAITVQQLGLSRVRISDQHDKTIAMINSFPTTDEIDFRSELSLAIASDSRRKVLAKVTYDIYNLIITYDTETNELMICKILLNALEAHSKISVATQSDKEIVIHNHFDNSKSTVNFNTLKVKHPQRLFSKDAVTYFKHENLLAIYVINKRRYYVYVKRNGIYIAKGNPLKVTQHKASLRILKGIKNFYIFGRFTHSAYNSFREYEYLYVRNSEHQIAKFHRPFAKIKLLKRYGFFVFPITSVNIDNRIHNNLYIGNKNRLIHNLHFKRPDKKVKTYSLKRQQDQLFVIRTNLKGNITATIIPFSEEYSLANRMKIKLAKNLSFLLKDRRRNLNLYFEKKSNKADESAFRVFEKVMDTETNRSENYFILNKQSMHYNAVKTKYGRNIIKKYSFRHYLSIFHADYLISSELSNHVLNDRLYIDSLRNKIMKTPLVFLQHGIMFAKPVDNPMAYGFHKDKTNYNVYKSVISSQLEAEEFKKMNYEQEDLILSGLATFDYANLEKGANKIAYMPTYRYWEEGLIYSNQLEETTYYKSIMKVIHAFEKEGLLDRLLIVPHNKFSDFIYDNMPEYRQIISNNPSEALKQSIIFITDYSSAIYDAIYRGAYPIFYWEEKDYLIRNYKAEPPVNDSNAPGPVVYDILSLMQTVKQAIQQEYQLEKEYINKYRNINQFHDNKNTNRIIQFLIEDGIL
ncbi:CDP-glycerol glycerophosphotransferase family protein [Ornithinibacillus scapharcae]|uniref:CDP-glycerol glycerophosphotransferase family protein n=1 Tax=Ornithinibacillus scapharcae TaxID=1147159 RepID=UPI000225BB4A|nr:CDP-glycerol glycerophosphotransferase family protein [Ornithinibacillus scapharcae]